MSTARIVWVFLCVASIICLGLIFFRFFAEDIPLIFISATLASVIFYIIFAFSTRTGKLLRAVFLGILIFVSIFTFLLYAGAIESVTLLNDSYIDISRCALILHLKNTGLPYWAVNQIRIANMTFSLKFPSGTTFNDRLHSGEIAYLVVYYVEGLWRWITQDYIARNNMNFTNLLDPWKAIDGSDVFSWSCDTIGRAYPNTFATGSNYQVTFDTGVKHTFEIEAKTSFIETLKVGGKITPSTHPEDYDSLAWVMFNNSGTYFSYVYTFTIADVVFTASSFIRITPRSYEFALFNVNATGIVSESVGAPGPSLQMSGNLTSATLLGNSVNVSAITLAGNEFTGQLIPESL
jgi:hypothetical protein